MGVHANIDFDRFPTQSELVGTITDDGVIVRNDIDETRPVKIKVRNGVAIVNGFPPAAKQGSFLGRLARVCFNYDTSRMIEGKIIRDDAEIPAGAKRAYEVIALKDGRYVLSTECMYSLA